MPKVRFIFERLDENGVPEQHEFETGKVKHNQGNGYNYVDRDGKLQCHLPGDVFEADDKEADRLVKTYPHMFMLETAWQALMAKLNRVRPDREAQRKKHAEMLKQRAEEQLAQDRLQRSIQEHQDNLRKATVLAVEHETKRATAEQERDAVNKRLEQLLAAMERQQEESKRVAEEQARRIAELEERLTAPTKPDDAAGGRRGRRHQEQAQTPPQGQEG